MLRVKVKVQGTEIVVANYARLRRYAGLAIRDGIMKKAERTLKRAYTYVPTRFNYLRDSGRVEQRRTRAISADVVFGGRENPTGRDVFYAWIVHEDMQAYHDDGQAKFLETAFLEESESFPNEVAGWVFAATLRR